MTETSWLAEVEAAAAGWKGRKGDSQERRKEEEKEGVGEKRGGRWENIEQYLKKQGRKASWMDG